MSGNWGSRGFNSSPPWRNFPGNMSNNRMPFHRGNQDYGNSGNQDYGNRGNQDYGNRGNQDFGNRGNPDFGKEFPAFKGSQFYDNFDNSQEYRGRRKQFQSSRVMKKQRKKAIKKQNLRAALQQYGKGKAKNPQELDPPGVSRPSTSGVKQQNQTTTSDEEIWDAKDVGEPPKTGKETEEILDSPPDKPQVVKNNQWRGDTSKMYSCSVCQYYTPDYSEIKEHLTSRPHKLVLKHLGGFLSKPKLIFLQDYLHFKMEEMLLEQKKNNIGPIDDRFKGIAGQHYFHRVEAAHCQACDVLIPDVEDLRLVHVITYHHRQNCRVTLCKIQRNSPAVAKALLNDKEMSQMLKKYQMGQDPFKDLPVWSIQVSSTKTAQAAKEHDDADDDNGGEGSIDYSEDYP